MMNYSAYRSRDNSNRNTDRASGSKERNSKRIPNKDRPSSAAPRTLVPSRRSRSSQAAALPCPALLAPCPSWRLPWPRTRRGQEPGLCCAARRHRHAQAPWSRRRTWFPRLAPASRRLREAGRLPHLAARALAEPPPPLAG
uniref:Uncharacterized protein n=1 Tax=Arundo donax TaxID=35708 RepID=A0A0A9EEA0_ARUDO